MLTGRLIDPNPAPLKTFALAKRWLGDCLASHNACTDGSDPIAPTRLVDVGTGGAIDNIRVIETQGMRAPYAYLSYIWGGNIPFPLSTSNYAQMLGGGLPFADLKTTVADGISIVRSCGLRYVWIDSLCIVQDSEEDRMRELPSMPKYLQNATFVLSAASSKNADQGLFRERVSSLHRLGTGRFTQRPLRFTDITPSAAECDLYLRDFLESATNTFRETMLSRCWLIQELILPRRLLVWGADQVYWTCRTCLWSEGSVVVEDPSWVKYLPPPEGAAASPNGISRSHLTWYSLVELYSSARVTVASDRLHAIQAFKEQFARRSIQSAYVAGLWVDDMANGLLWYVERLKAEKAYGSPPAPTWSWASIDGCVTYCLLRGARTDKISDESHRVSFVDASCDRGNDAFSVRYGISDAGYVKLDAMVLGDLENGDQASRRQRLECKYFFDCPQYEKRFHDDGEGGGGQHILMFVAPWYAGSVGPVAAADLRCIGLVLFDEGVSGDNPANHTRAGLFLGLRYDGRLEGWERRTVMVR